jgi:hypothetical protein
VGSACVLWQVESEINILRGERDQAKDIIDDLQKKLQAVTAVLADYDAERQVGCHLLPAHASRRGSWSQRLLMHDCWSCCQRYALWAAGHHRTSCTAIRAASSA